MTRPRSFATRVRMLRTAGRMLADDLDELEALFVRREPEVRAFVPEPQRFERLRREAAELEQRFPAADDRPPLFGLLVAVKDIFHVDGFETRAGSQVPASLLAGPEAASVKRLRHAGALIVGKAMTTEFAYFAPGPTRNPRHLERTPGGSSSGSAAAVAAGMSELALGTQTIGSISRPASFCGVVGFKPSYDRIPRAGVVPLAPTLDHVGIFVECMSDALLAAPVLCDDWREPSARSRQRLGVPVGPYLECAGEGAREHFGAATEELRQAGFDVVEVPVMADFAEIRRRHERIVEVEAARAHAPWFTAWAKSYHAKTRDLIERGLEVDAETYSRAVHGRTELRGLLEEAREESRVDLWLSPAATGPAPAGLDWTGDPVMNLPWTHAGVPTLALPAGTVEGLPMGLQLAAGWQRDEELLACGVEIERVLGEGVDV